MARTKAAKKKSSRISERVEQRIVEVALQNPEFGARRLVPLLKRKKIKVSASQIYSVLKRHDLQTREKRTAGREGQVPKSKAPPDKTSPEITPEIREHIIAVSLQHPDFSAKRLLPLLKKDNIYVSASRVYSIMKRHGLQSRAKRLAALEARRRAEATTIPETAASEITPEAEERLIEVCLQNPDHGARRLAGLLAGEGIRISSSAIYTRLKRHSLQTRALRLAKIEALRAVELPVQTVETPSKAKIPIPTPSAEPEAVPEAIPEKGRPSRGSPVPRVYEKVPLRSRLLLHIVNVLLLVLLGYLGFLALQNVRQARMEPQAVATSGPSTVPAVLEIESAVQEPLQDYRKIWERNLFNVKISEATDSETQIQIEKIALAKKDIGLKLVGTVVADDASLSRAIIDVQKTKDQEAYREGEKAGEARIKKILRNKVVITTATGDQLLAIEAEDFAKSSTSAAKRGLASGSVQYPQQVPGAAAPGSPVTGSSFNRARSASINLKRGEVETALADTDRLLQEVKVTPFLQGDNPAGFIINNIPRGSILTRMGLRNGYVVKQLNDSEITSPDQAAEFFRTLAAGGEVTFQIQRSKGVRRRSQTIHLNIE